MATLAQKLAKRGGRLHPMRNHAQPAGDGDGEHGWRSSRLKVAPHLTKAQPSALEERFSA
jgi:hypothetical protein